MSTVIHDEQDGSIPEHLCLISLGSNLGDSAGNIKRAFRALQIHSLLPIRKSSLWQSTPVDCPPDSPDFINAAA
ncbi:MAG: hypothetical protein HOL43_09520, partial [Verrucomicrobiales bacterium]|nr:hypothetical protein [Verrucomicrobiales bacterium]